MQISKTGGSLSYSVIDRGIVILKSGMVMKRVRFLSYMFLSAFLDLTVDNVQ